MTTRTSSFAITAIATDRGGWQWSIRLKPSARSPEASGQLTRTVLP